MTPKYIKQNPNFNLITSKLPKVFLFRATTSICCPLLAYIQLPTACSWSLQVRNYSLQVSQSNIQPRELIIKTKLWGGWGWGAHPTPPPTPTFYIFQIYILIIYLFNVDPLRKWFFFFFFNVSFLEKYLWFHYRW